MELDFVHKRIDELERRIERLSNNAAPTIPSQDSTNFPQDAVYGQIVKDVNDHSVWVYGEDDAWHKVGGGKVGAYARGYYDTISGGDPGYGTNPSSNRWMSFTHRASSDVGAIDFITTTENHDTFKLNGDFNHGGVYYFVAAAQLQSSSNGNMIIGVFSTFDQFPHLSIIGLDSIVSFVSPLGEPTHMDFAMQRVQSGQGSNVRVMLENRDSLLTMYNVFSYVSCIYVPTDDEVLNFHSIG